MIRLGSNLETFTLHPRQEWRYAYELYRLSKPNHLIWRELLDGSTRILRQLSEDIAIFNARDIRYPQIFVSLVSIAATKLGGQKCYS